MITIYKSTSEGLLTVDDFVAGSWVHVSNPSNQELALLVERFGIPLDFLTDPLDPTSGRGSRPRTAPG